MMRDKVLQLVLHSLLRLRVASIRKVVSNEQSLIFLCEVLELDSDRLKSYCLQGVQKQLTCLFPGFFLKFPQWYSLERELSACAHLLSPYLPTSGIVSLQCPPAAKQYLSRFPLSYGITSA